MSVAASGSARLRAELNGAARPLRALARRERSLDGVGAAIAPELFGADLLDLLSDRLRALLAPGPVAMAAVAERRRRGARSPGPPEDSIARTTTAMERDGAARRPHDATVGWSPAAREGARDDEQTARAARSAPAAPPERERRLGAPASGEFTRGSAHMGAEGAPADARPRAARYALTEHERCPGTPASGEPTPRSAQSGAAAATPDARPLAGGALADAVHRYWRAVDASRAAHRAASERPAGGTRHSPLSDGMPLEWGERLAAAAVGSDASTRAARGGPPAAWGPTAARTDAPPLPPAPSVAPLPDADAAQMLRAFVDGVALPEPARFGAPVAAWAATASHTAAAAVKAAGRPPEAPPVTGHQVWRARTAAGGSSRAAALRDLAEDMADIVREQAVRHGIDVP